jgi:hypothetical protein
MNFTESKSTALAIFGQVRTESSHGRKSEPSTQKRGLQVAKAHGSSTNINKKTDPDDINYGGTVG